MSRQSIEIPDPVLTWEVSYEPGPQQNYFGGTYTAQAVVGGVTVFERSYSEYDSTNPPGNPGVESDDAARDRAARELGEKLRELLS